MTYAYKIDLEFLKHLDADGGAARIPPSRLNQGFGDETFRGGLQIVAVEQNIGVEESFNGHDFDPA